MALTPTPRTPKFELESYITDDSSQYMETYCVKPENLNETELTWYCFLGDIRLKDNLVDLSTRREGLPLLNFALAMTEIAEDLRSHAKATYNFTENAEEINFSKNGSMIQITATYTHGTVEVPHPEFSKAADKCLLDTYSGLTARYPGLKKNNLLSHMYNLKRLSIEEENS
ncbi:MAG TPA: hypothetical protein VMT30_06475 [Candidatus Saccharimonadia bacterium]|nr:hypothetical protein [Candidatus Saccharimonadia bacterium]